MTQVLKESQQLLTGNVFVDNGLAIIAALAGCDTIEDLTLRKMKLKHGNGEKLASTNMRLKSNYLVFVNSITQQPRYSEKDRIDKYSKITRALLDNIGHEQRHEYCDFCGNMTSVDLDRLFIETFGSSEKKKKGNNRHFVGRDWFPLAGSMLNDAQGLPCGSRSLNCCAKCLFAVQYLPQASILMNGLLCLFQSTSTTFWYQWVKNLVTEVEKRIALASNRDSNDKVETPGKAEGNTEVANMLL